MGLRLSAPGKTFLLGEYVALSGGPALLAATGPRFKLKIHFHCDRPSEEFAHPQSPAGRLLQKYGDELKEWDLKFVDPYEGAGGLGASSAQFLLLYALLTWKNSPLLQAERELDLKAVLAAHRECAWNGEGVPPSGADLVAQIRGGLCYFDKKNGILKSSRWPFDKLGFSLFKTPFKLATHEHLRTLSEVPQEGLAGWVRAAQKAIEEKKPESFVDAVKGFGAELHRQQLVCSETSDLLAQLKSSPLVLAGKGCGALGADVILALHETMHSRDVDLLAQSLNLKRIAGSEDLSDGIRLKLEGRQEKEKWLSLPEFKAGEIGPS